jgi:hypothetical protein
MCRRALQRRGGRAPFLPLWGSFLHALAEAATGFPAWRLRASLHATAKAAAAQAAELPREPFAKAPETASRRTATRALGIALLGLVGCGGVLVRRCHRVGPLLVPVADGPEATVGIGWPTTRPSGTTTMPARAGRRQQALGPPAFPKRPARKARRKLSAYGGHGSRGHAR